MTLFTEFRQLLQRYGLEYFKKYYGVYRATVADNEDPDKLGRLKLDIPQIYGSQVHDYWAWPKGMPSGDGKGFLMLPAIGDAVYVCFEGGDAKYPIWEHGWWGNGEAIKATKKNYPDVSAIQTASGHKIEFDDKDEFIRIESNIGILIEINEKGISLVRSGKKISIGALDGSAEPAVLGDKNQQQHKDEIAHIRTLTTELTKLLTAFKPLNPVAIAAAGVKLSTLQAQLTATEARTETTKSKNVTIDG